MTLTHEDAKGCPFCGGISTVEEIETGCWGVGCNNCDLQVMSGPVGIGWFRSEHDAVKTWNDRNSDFALERANDFLKDYAAELAASQAEVARLRGALESIAEYTGEGPAAADWRAIVKTIASGAREALK